MWRFGWLGLLCFVCLSVTANGQSLQEVQAVLRGLDAAFVMNEARTGAAWRLNEPRCSQRFAPFSTLEVPLALTALQTRVVPNLNAVMPWNRVKHPLRATDTWELTHWTEDQTLRSALTNSVEWYWWETSEKLGSTRWQKALHQFNYGNQTLPDKLLDCWTDSALQISAEEQFDFTRKLADEKLGIYPTLQRNIKNLLLRERGINYRFYLKTSTSFLENGRYLGWSIGWLETQQGTAVFAFNITHADLNFVKEAVLILPKKLLLVTGEWPVSE